MSLFAKCKSGAAVTAMAVACFGAGSTHAAPVLVIDGSGKLAGAKGVTVGALGLFDVRFEDGTCAAVFGSCQGPDAFAFSTEGSALLASQALLDQVFLDSVSGQFDSNPALTVGCEADSRDFCGVLTPYPRTVSGQFFGVARNYGLRGLGADGAVMGGDPPNLDYGQFPFLTWAVWSPSPPTPDPGGNVAEPGTLALLGVAGLALGWTQRRRRIGVAAQ
jgi:hypothetical protein